jgi:hypothetical protein
LTTATKPVTRKHWEETANNTRKKFHLKKKEVKNADTMENLCIT